MAPIEKGVWYDVLLNVKWSEAKDGFSELFLNGKSLTKAKVSGKNMYNSLSHPLQLGMYRHPGIPFVNSVFFDELWVGHRSPHAYLYNYGY